MDNRVTTGDARDQQQHTGFATVGSDYYPVLVGVEGERDMMLSSPIILYDYPQIAPESPGRRLSGIRAHSRLLRNCRLVAR